MEFVLQGEFWLAVGQIIMIDVLLGGDNAVVIALACRQLPPALRTKGILWGTAGAYCPARRPDLLCLEAAASTVSQAGGGGFADLDWRETPAAGR